jgi:hypothetical protein
MLGNGLEALLRRRLIEAATRYGIASGQFVKSRYISPTAINTFNRPGPRIAVSLEILAGILHPQIFHFGHEGSGWRRLRSAS